MKLNMSAASIIESGIRGSISTIATEITFFDDVHKKIFHLMANLSNSKSIPNEREFVDIGVYKHEYGSFLLSHIGHSK